MEFLPQQNKRVAGDDVPGQILATGKSVVIIGGGDTGADCLGTCHRQKAKAIKQFEIMPQAARTRARPALRGRYGLCNCALRARTKRAACAIGPSTRRHFTGDAEGNVRQLHAIRVGPPPKFEAMRGTEFVIDADLVLLALGFSGPVKKGMIGTAGRESGSAQQRGNRRQLHESVPGIFAAGDMRRGQSLVVWAISEGRKAARAVDQYLMGSTL